MLQDKLGAKTALNIREPVRLRFELSTSDPAKTPLLDAYRLTFERKTK